MNGAHERDPIGLVLAGVLLLALALRLWGIGFGLPYDLTADEPHQILQALRLGAGDGGPLVRIWHTVGKSGLDCLLFVEYALLYVVWRTTGRVSGPDELALAYLTDPTAFYLLGRVSIALMGTATCLVVFWAGRRMFGPRVALGASVIAATSFFHGATSHVINVHVAMAFTLWTGIAAYLKYEAVRRRRVLLAAGFLLGTAVAFAYTAVIGALLVLLAIVTSNRVSFERYAAAKRVFLLAASSLLAIVLLSPDLIVGAGALAGNFSQVAGDIEGGADRGASELRSDIDSVTILRVQDWWGYAAVLSSSHNAALVAAALVGAVAGIFQKHRWSVLLASACAVFLLVVSASGRAPAERYLLPILPAIWLLSSYGVSALARGRSWAIAAGLAVVIALPLYQLVGQDFLWTRSDTRVVAKEWIEANVPADSRILVDAMRFRFVQGPPLRPNDEAVARSSKAMSSSELTASGRMISLRAEALRRLEGPKYDLYSTVYGLEVAPLDHYVRSCFDYVVTSSLNEARYASPEHRARFPESARFYEEIRNDPRFPVVYAVGPVAWERRGPSITVRRVLNPCGPHRPEVEP